MRAGRDYRRGGEKGGGGGGSYKLETVQYFVSYHLNHGTHCTCYRVETSTRLIETCEARGYVGFVKFGFLALNMEMRSPLILV